MNRALATMGKTEPVSGARSVVSRFALRRMLVGSIVFAVFAAAESTAQAIGIVAAYPDVATRAKAVYGLAANAELGLFYGDRHGDIITPTGYMVYRIAPILALVGAIWGLTFMTKMLRGQEETGRWELLLSGQVSARTATAKTVMGAAAGIVVSFVVMSAVLALAGRSNKFGLSVGGALVYTLTVLTAAMVGIGIGALTSQLGATRRRASLYGIVVIVAFYVLRAVGNVVDSLAWLKNFTPFGWIDKIHPLPHAQLLWLLPIGLVVGMTSAYAIWLAGKRDMTESYIADTTSARPRLTLLGSQLGFDFRETRAMLFGWLVASVAFAATIASIDKSVAKTLSTAGKLSKSLGTIAGNPNARIELAYLGATGYLVAIVLMVLVTNGLGATREEESSGRLDNFLSGTVGRSYWLSMRLLLLILGVVSITLLTNILTWSLAEAQGIHTSFAMLVFGGLSILGPVAFLLGVGTLLYGAFPRFVTIVMYAVIGWSFTIDIVAPALKTSKYIADTSLLHHLALVPAAHPKWGAFSVLTVSGMFMMCVGILALRRRDLQAE
jgi:ABC-2 type transport system permease protein